MSNKSVYSISEDDMHGILDTKSGWIVLRSGSVINKSFIVEIRLDKAKQLEDERNEAQNMKIKELPPTINTEQIQKMRLKVQEKLKKNIA